MTVLRKISIFLSTLILSLLLLTACGQSAGAYYVPPAYGQNNQCYYVNDPIEVTGPGGLYDAGLCPRTWTPYLMPVTYHYMYAAFYDSPAYYQSYVPVSYRTTYTTYVTTFEKSPDYQKNESQYASQATWKDNKGKTVPGSTVQKQEQSGKASFGGGSVRSSGFSSGSARSSNGKPANGSSNSKPSTSSDPSKGQISAPPAANPQPAAPKPPAAKPAAPAKSGSGGFTSGSGRSGSTSSGKSGK